MARDNSLLYLLMDSYLPKMGQKTKTKSKGKISETPSLTPHAAEDTSLPPSQDISPSRMEESNGDGDENQEEMHIDYKQLAMETARQISPDIQETWLTQLQTCCPNTIQSPSTCTD